VPGPGRWRALREPQLADIGRFGSRGAARWSLLSHAGGYVCVKAARPISGSTSKRCAQSRADCAARPYGRCVAAQWESGHAGDGRPVVLLHSGGCTWREWRSVLTLLADEHEVLAPTLPGSYGGPPSCSADDRDGYFVRCWPGAGRQNAFEIVRLIEHEDEVVATYETETSSGVRGRNTEVFTFDKDNRIARIEVYFGWNLD